MLRTHTHDLAEKSFDKYNNLAIGMIKWSNEQMIPMCIIVQIIYAHIFQNLSNKDHVIPTQQPWNCLDISIYHSNGVKKCITHLVYNGSTQSSYF